MRNYSSRKGFTLAEVLITLGIIGVVAALTIPNMIAKYQIKTLQVNFNRMDKQIRDALVELQYENNTDDFFKVTSNAGLSQNSKYAEVFYSKFNIIDKLDTSGILNIACPLSYSGKQQDCFVNGFSLKPSNVLKDGSTIGFVINSWQTYIYFDTNGPYKGPNRLGYDTFMIVTHTSKNLGEEHKELEKCSMYSNNSQNGWSCYYYAKNDINPDDPEKGYWKNLKL